MATSFLNFLSKMAVIWIFSKLQFFLIADIKLLFPSRNYFKSFQCKIKLAVGCFAVYVKIRDF